MRDANQAGRALQSGCSTVKPDVNGRRPLGFILAVRAYDKHPSACVQSGSEGRKNLPLWPLAPAHIVPFPGGDTDGEQRVRVDSRIRFDGKGCYALDSTQQHEAPHDGLSVSFAATDQGCRRRAPCCACRRSWRARSGCLSAERPVSAGSRSSPSTEMGSEIVCTQSKTSSLPDGLTFSSTFTCVDSESARASKA